MLEDIDRYNQNDLSALMRTKGFNGCDQLFLSSGRGALNFILDNMNDERKIVILPAFTCETVIFPFYLKEYTIYFYHISSKFEIDCFDLERKIKLYNPSIILFHSIFGFYGWQGIIPIVQKYSKDGIAFIEDRSMDWFVNRYCTIDVDYVVGSFRKWFAIPDGGFIYSAKKKLINKPMVYHEELVAKKKDAYCNMYKYRVLNEGSFEECKQKCKEAEILLEREKHYYCMSPFSVALLCSTDIKQICEKRRNNYNYLYKSLCGLAELSVLSPELERSDTIVPFHFVVASLRKEGLINYLNSCNIYPSNVWETLDYFPDIKVNEFERYLYGSAFFLEIDQMYSIQDMDRVVSEIRKYLH